MYLNNKNYILITGGCGFIGSHLCKHFLNIGYNVLCLDNLDNFYAVEIKYNNIRSLILHPNFHFIKADICDKALMSDILAPFDIGIVIHLAAKVNVRNSFLNKEEHFKTNVLGTSVLLEVMQAKKIKKIIFASSSSVYGESKNNILSETDELMPISPYAHSKKMAEALLKKAHLTQNMEIIILRLFNAYGAAMRPDLFIHKAIHAIQRREKIELYNNGHNQKDYTFITDIVQAFDLAIKFVKRKQYVYEIFNIGKSECYSTTQLVQTLESIMQQKAVTCLTSKVEGDVSFTKANLQKSKLLLNYDPTISLYEGLKLCCQYYINH